MDIRSLETGIADSCEMNQGLLQEQPVMISESGCLDLYLGSDIPYLGNIQLNLFRPQVPHL